MYNPGRTQQLTWRSADGETSFILWLPSSPQGVDRPNFCFCSLLTLNWEHCTKYSKLKIQVYFLRVLSLFQSPRLFSLPSLLSSFMSDYFCLLILPSFLGSCRLSKTPTPNTHTHTYAHTYTCAYPLLPSVIIIDVLDDNKWHHCFVLTVHSDVCDSWLQT